MHWNKNVYQLIIPQSGFFILTKSQKEYAIYANVHAVLVFQYIGSQKLGS